MMIQSHLGFSIWDWGSDHVAREILIDASPKRVYQCVIHGILQKRWGEEVYIHQKLNGTESQRTPDQVSCDRAIRHSGLGVRETWVLLEISWIISKTSMSNLKVCKVYVP